MTMFSHNTQQATPLVDNKVRNKLIAGYDFWLITSLLLIISVGLIMVTSASISAVALPSPKGFGDPLHYFRSQGQSIILGLFLMLMFLKMPIYYLQTSSRILLFVAIALLGLTIFPGIGKEVNGSMRWIEFGYYNLFCWLPCSSS